MNKASAAKSTGVEETDSPSEVVSGDLEHKLKKLHKMFENLSLAHEVSAYFATTEQCLYVEARSKLDKKVYRVIRIPFL